MESNFNPVRDLAHIRSMMERSSRFISLSGLSGVFAGVVALLGSVYAAQRTDYFEANMPPLVRIAADPLTDLLLVAGMVLVLSVGGGLFFTIRRSSKTGQKLWDASAFRLLVSLCVPLGSGGLFCLIMLLKFGYYDLVAPGTLLFYGLALFQAGRYSLPEIRYLGLTEIALALATAVWGYELEAWAMGFGVLHIVYGGYMYRKYDLNS